MYINMLPNVITTECVDYWLQSVHCPLLVAVLFVALTKSHPDIGHIWKCLFGQTQPWSDFKNQTQCNSTLCLKKTSPTRKSIVRFHNIRQKYYWESKQSNRCYIFHLT